MRRPWLFLLLCAACGGSTAIRDASTPDSTTLASLHRLGTGDSLVVSRAGVAHVGARRWEVPPSQMGSLAALLASPDIAELDSVYQPADTAAPGPGYLLTIPGEHGMRRVRLTESSDPPGPLRLALHLMQQIGAESPELQR